jgi:uncharacterized membrane protein
MKENFLSELEKRLSFLPENEKREIIKDFNEHIQIGKYLGKDLNTVIKSLGSPEEIANELIAEYSSYSPINYTTHDKLSLKFIVLNYLKLMILSTFNVFLLLVYLFVWSFILAFLLSPVIALFFIYYNGFSQSLFFIFVSMTLFNIALLIFRLIKNFNRYLLDINRKIVKLGTYIC